MNASYSLNARDIAESIVQIVEWQNGAKAICICPGEDLHTTRSGPTDCAVIVQTLPDGCLPGVYCFHDSCKTECEEASRKLRQALRTIEPKAMQRPLGTMPRKPKPVYRSDVLAAIAAKRPDVTSAFLAQRSAVDPRTVSPELFLFSLFRKGERVLVFNVFASQGQHVWRHLGSLAALNRRELDRFKKGAKRGVWFLCNPISGQRLPKPTPDNPDRMTRRDTRCITAFRYILFESDQAPEGLWLAAIAQLDLPIVAIYRSAGKSIHVLVRLDAKTEAEWRERREKLRELMITLGADGGASSPTQLTRLPGCERLGTDDRAGDYIPFEIPRLQELLYLAPNADCTPIVELEVRHE